MNRKLRQAYASLVPADQIIVDAMIVALAKKDKQIRDCVRGVEEMLNEKLAREAAD